MLLQGLHHVQQPVIAVWVEASDRRAKTGKPAVGSSRTAILADDDGELRGSLFHAFYPRLHIVALVVVSVVGVEHAIAFRIRELPSG